MLYYLLRELTVYFCEALQYTMLEYTRSYWRVPLGSYNIILTVYSVWEKTEYEYVCALLLMNVDAVEIEQIRVLTNSFVSLY